MTDYVQLHPADVRCLLHLLAQVQDRVPPSLARERLLRGLCRLTRAQAALCMRLRLTGASWSVVWCDAFGWADHRQRMAAAPLFAGDAPADPMCAIAGRKGRVITLSRRQVLDDREWYTDPHVLRVRKPAGVDDCIYSLYRLNSHGNACGNAGCISLHRRWGHSSSFSAREVQLLHLLHTELEGLYRNGDSPADSTINPAVLSQRQQQTLNLLLAGCSEKQVAERLGLSPHTVHVHVRGVYRRLGVNTRAELLSRFVGQSGTSNAGNGEGTVTA